MERLKAKLRQWDADLTSEQLHRHTKSANQQAERHTAERVEIQGRLDDARQREGTLTDRKTALMVGNEKLRSQIGEQQALQERLREEHSMAVAEGHRLTSIKEEKEARKQRQEDANEDLSRSNDALSREVQRLNTENEARQRQVQSTRNEVADEEANVRRLEQELRRYASGRHTPRCPNNRGRRSGHFCLQCPYGIIAYHRTTREHALNIENHGVDINRCSNGYAGKGFYCASRPDLTRHKVRHQPGHTDWIVKVGLRLGRPLELGRGPDSQLDERRVKQRGFDSVIVTDRHGLEFVVYSGDQVEVISTYQG
ncbi:unnamed protein product [Vitrella brassicaformis CCMP3155]|uniref:PARP catalytic domain-containing protein n=1 Tax=Vitrella brassicaformis (strain CCMP3155) TaxID=1169540 RepID=A0A0G4FZ61_VITBC|nr:unnamed protein product [Vitrella brassicaformis CCMP3155]|eukprot:CEM20894.1 unnamed protein product [Vitrella brassicaformis CCMP3155]